jgi:hypothetical protein
MRVFEAYYSESSNCGDGKEGQGVVVSETEKEALKHCLEKHSGTKAEFWDFEELDTTTILETVLIYPISN